MLRTCPKCGKQFYGVACPECDYPPRPADASERKRERLWGLVFLAIGFWVAVEAIVLPSAPLPAWPAFVAGVVFFLAGVGTVKGVKGRPASALGAMICAGLASLGFFAAFARGEIDGGIPVLPAAWNQGLGRIAFGGGACLTGAFGLWLFYQAVIPSKRR